MKLVINTKEKKLNHKLISTLEISYFVAMVMFWVYINYTGLVDTTLNYLFGLFLAFVPLAGFISGIFISKEWGYTKSALGKAILFISIGLLLWSLGTFFFAYFNFTGIEVPYPSVADIFYVSLYVFYILGATYFMKIIGATYNLKSAGGKLAVILIPIAVFAFSFRYLFDPSIFTESTLNFTLLLDIFYPLGDVFLLSITLITLLLSHGYSGGKYRMPTYILLFGFTIEFIADTLFTIKTANETFFVAGITDLFFLLSTFLVSYSILLFSSSRLLESDKVL